LVPDGRRNISARLRTAGRGDFGRGGFFKSDTKKSFVVFPWPPVHTHSPYTNGIAISVIDEFQHIIEEAKIVVGNPVLISNKPSGSADLANLVSEAFGHGGEDLRAVIIKNHGVVAVGSNIDQARAVVEALEEWAKILTVSKIFGGPKYVLDNST
jgi:ribulose-5-phosphate 4-epimerase/fuculose-1-phosphate aldolase